MEDSKRDLLGLLCGIYMSFILSVIPLYTGGRFYQIGDRKYFVFRNLSCFCLGLWLVIEVMSLITQILQRKCEHNFKQIFAAVKKSISTVDVFVMLYGIINIISMLFSDYPAIAWAGYREWYMGALSQIIFVLIYFFVSRRYDGKAYPVYIGETVLFIIVIIGLANRMGLDILGMYRGYTEADWEYSHMLSTIGNINWLCGYITVVLPLCITGYLYCDEKKYRPAKKTFLFLTCTAALALLFIQGSDIGVIISAVSIIFCLGIGIIPLYRTRIAGFFEKGLLLAGMMMLAVAFMGEILVMRGKTKTIPDDSPIQATLGNPLWWIIAVFIMIMYLIHKKADRKVQKSIRYATILIIVTAIIYVMVWAAINYTNGITIFGANQRTEIWKAGMESFEKAPMVKKLIGVGPDCFAEYMYTQTETDIPIVSEGYWKGVVFANAHNEWLNQLINIGIVGVTIYAGIFICAVGRYKGMPMGLLLLLLYFINSVVSFQQVLNAPILFLALGMCERSVRNVKNTGLTVK